MLLTQLNPYKSIRTFEEIELPDFALITGRNGSGKSQLLHAIANGQVLVNGRASREMGHVEVVEASTFRPRSESFDSHGWVSTWKASIPSMLDEIDRASSALLRDLRVLVPDATDHELRGILNDPLRLVTAYGKGEVEHQALKSNVSAAVGSLLSRVGGDQGIAMTNISKVFGRSILNLKAIDLDGPIYGNGGHDGAISVVFVNYRDNKFRNMAKRMANREGRGDVEFLDEVQFEERFGRAPWSVVDDVLNGLGLDFRISRPDEFDLTPYQPVLEKVSDGTIVPFGELSAGEVVLLNLALMSYSRWDRRIDGPRTGMLLLDEVDAPLHPAMARTYIETVVGELQKLNGIPVLATTHSMSTVAVAPESSIYVLHSDPHRLEKVSKARALGVLGEGVPMLAVSFNGRRQVFCESEFDAAAYGALYQNLRSRLLSERSLDFIAVGVSTDKGDMGRGKDAVRKVVDQLSESGNVSVLGIVDWDGVNVQEGRVRVLAPGLRDGLENVLFDPLLIAALVTLRFDTLRESIGIPKAMSLAELKSLPNAELQSIADAVESLVLVGVPPQKRRAVSYLGGASVLVSDAYLTMDDHELGDRVLEAFGFKSIVNNRTEASAHGRLMVEIASTVCREAKELVPDELMSTLSGLLEMELSSAPLDTATPPPHNSPPNLGARSVQKLIVVVGRIEHVG